MPSGLIEFYTCWGKPVEDGIYQSASHRHRIMKGWEQLYGAKFRQGYVHILPDEEDLLTKADGTNATKKEKRNVEIINLKNAIGHKVIANRYRLSPNHIHKIQRGVEK
jgi:hypothetical protein